MDQQSAEYLEHERNGDGEAFWGILLRRLNLYQAEPSEARRRAEAAWNSLYWPGDIDFFHTLLGRALTGMRRVHLPQPDHIVMLRCLELIPRDKTIMLEGPLRRPRDGWTTES